ncbi:zinc-binding dehydrogenase [Amycolatopsis sp. OK19-0408]|uniref:Zinc-binding dehydrogenase n=1 Tax=Amycolatopsis iheyensis TaxID=2945988 RepID=A0A9X2NFX4_9PSEU|nr:zinc-binding dehydrogenase [Amycolatopsis iheyensis]MCR6488086.1 zinc-binding dehydrogenase [Amycolatopsis iheyensis]
MKTVVIKEFGGPRGLAVVDAPAPTPGAGQVLIDVEAIGVGGVDVLVRSGAIAGFAAGHVPGGEVAGTVTAVGAGVDPMWTGRRVWAFTGVGGGYVEQALAPVEEVLALPGELSAADAVTLGSSGVVAHFGLAHAHFTAGESVLVRGAAGGIGTMAVQLAARAGASAVAVMTSSPERAARLRALGATHVLDRAGGFDVIIDVVAGAALSSFLTRLNPNGRLVVVGAVGGPPPADVGTTLMTGFRQSWSFAVFSAASIPVAERQAVRAAQFEAAVRGELRAVVHERLPLADAVLAHEKLAARAVFGRLVLVP